MQQPANPKAHRAFDVVPELRHTVPWRVATVSALSGARLRVTFVDGAEGEVDLSRFLNSHQVVGTVFEALRDPTLFAQAEVVHGAVRWPNGADLAPDAMYDVIRERGIWILE